MKFVADLHLHSKYSRAVSQDMVLPTMAAWGKKKGIDILTTGDWTHPLWFREIRGLLEEAGEGVYKLKSPHFAPPTGEASRGKQNEPLFLLTVEVSSIYSQGGKLRRIHNLIFAPNFDTAEKINQELHRRSVNLLSDGRPIMGLSSINLIELVLGIDKNALLIPCHAWTPWFSLYGSNSGFDSIEECFGDWAKYIYGVETGLSSDPEMNWRIKDLEDRALLSFSDAHSPAKMGREATVFDIDTKRLRYEDIRNAIVDRKGIAYTIEFYPEEGKYHYTGHRNCKVVQMPEETKTNGSTCPVCQRKLTVGVMHRVEQLARQSQISNLKSQISTDEYGIRWIKDESGKRPPFVKLVPLLEIIAEAFSSTTASGKVREAFENLVEKLGSEMAVLLQTNTAEIAKLAGPRVAEGIKKVRSGDIVIAPGFDGEYGKVKIWDGEKVGQVERVAQIDQVEQMGLF
ncbi:DNA helicase UvrD [Candidatus Microgenomates bacterium]|nr:DNA helicase UvrD [Candidatus Microgenomates bacterium]